MPQELYLSWSALKTHEECRHKEYLQRTKHRPESVNIRNFVHGTIADRVVRRFLDEDDPTVQKPGRMQEYVQEIFDIETRPIADGGNADGVVKWRGQHDRAVMLNFVRELVTQSEPYLFEYVIPYDYATAVRFKQPLTIPYLDGAPALIWLVGEMDILVRKTEEPPDWLGIDLKGTRNERYWAQTLGQVIFYDLACQAMNGIHCTSGWAFLQPMCKEQWLPVRPSDEDRRIMVNRVTKMAHARWSGDHDPKDSNKGCSECHVKHACAKYHHRTDGHGYKRVSLT